MLAPMKKSIPTYTLKLSLLLSCFSIVSISSVFAKTKQSELVEYLQETYTDQGQSYPILIMDQDEIEVRYARQNAFGEDEAKEKLRASILKEYIEEKSGVALKANDANSLEMYTSVIKEGAYAVPLIESYSEMNYKLCMVFPASVNSNIRLETHRILGLDTPGAYDENTYDRLKKYIPYDVLRMYSILHELGHCLDRTFMPKAYRSYEPNAHDVHQSESFAETFATFMLVKEGYANWAKTRALYRNLYTQHMGRWFIDNPNNGFGNPLYLKGGLIYYLVPSLLEAHKVISKNRDLKDWSVMDYITQAEIIIKDKDISSRGFHATFRAMNEDTEEVLDFYRSYALNSPDLFGTAYSEMLYFLDFSPYLVGEILSDEETSAMQDFTPRAGSLVPLERSDLNQKIQNYRQDPSEENKRVLEEEVDLYRENLEQAFDLDYTSIAERKKILDRIWDYALN